MKAQAAKPTQKAARSERAPPLLATPAMMPPANDFFVQRKSCACGGSCPRCQQDDDFRIQPKLEIGPVGDVYEQEADRIAEQVMGSSAPFLSSEPQTERTESRVQRACTTCGEKKSEDEPERVQRSSSDTAPTANSDRGAESIGRQSLVSGGQALASGTRHFYESRFNRDLSSVRVHTGAAANEYCDNLDAHAFTYGNHIWLGKRVDASPSFVMAHELAHVVQQTQPALRRKENRDPFESPTSSSTPKVQRLPFWVPINTREGKISTGSEIHRELFGLVKNKEIKAEAPVPNAIRSAWGLGLQGYADFYKADHRVGVYFDNRAGLEPGDKTGSDRHDKPKKTSRSGSDPAPTVKRGGKIDKISSGPKSIEIGELKPAALTELIKGKDQLENYKHGFDDAAALTNLWAKQRSIAPWQYSPAALLPDSAIPAASVDRDLALADIDEVSSDDKKKETVKYKVKKVFLPKWYLGQEIPGKLHLEPFGQGLWVYYGRPNDFSAALDLPTFRRNEKQAYMRTAQAVQDEVIGNLTRGPEKITLFPRHYRAPQPHAAPMQIRRKPKKTKLKDHFDEKEFERWSKRQSELGKEVRGDGDAKGDKTSASTFRKLEFLDVASKAQQAAASKAMVPKFPTATDLAENIPVKGSTVAKPMSLDNMFHWLERWTSPAYKILGQFRLRFGDAFVGAVNFFSKIKDGIGTKVKEFFDEGIKKKSVAGTLIKALGTALKQVINLVVPHTLSLVQDAVATGIKKKLQAVFADSFVGKSIAQFQTWFDQIKEYAKNAQTYVDEVKKRFLDKFDWIDSLLGDVKWFWRLIKIGRTAMTCAKRPPVLSCLRLFKSSDKDLNCILCIPAVQKGVAKRVMEVSWFSSIPVTLGNHVMDVLRGAVPKDASTLQEVLSEKIPDSKPSSEDITPECDVKCEGGAGLFKAAASGGDIKPDDADAMEQFSEFGEKLSDEEREEVSKEAERQGVQDQPFDKKKAEELLNEAKKRAGDSKGTTPPPPSQGQKPGNDANKRSRKQSTSPPAPPPPDKNTKPPSAPDKPDKLKPGQRLPAPPPNTPNPKPDDTDKQQRKPNQGQGQGQRQRQGVAGGKPGQGQGGSGGGCIWNTSELHVGAWILEPRDDGSGGSNVMDWGYDFDPFSKQPIKRECAVKLKIKTDYTIGACARPEPFTPPVVSAEITFQSAATSKTKELFKQTDNNPWVNPYFAEPSWKSIVMLNQIEESGTLQIKITMVDPDTGTVRSINEKFTIDIVTQKQDPNLCCRCIS